MPTALEILQAEVLRPPRVDRTRASLDTGPSVEAAWDELADQREQALSSGAVSAVPIEVVLALLGARFPGKR